MTLYKNEMIRINLWASPRNISTAIMYSFSQRKDTTVVDEPFYAAYLAKTGAKHPGRDAILKTQSQSFEKVARQVIHAQYETPIVFFKQMSHHVRGENLSHFESAINVILIRNPKDMIISFSRVIQQPSIDDLGLKDSLLLLNHFRNRGHETIVVNSDDLLKEPDVYLKKWCSSMKISFDEKMLSWPKGPKREDGVWAPFWYSNVHQSTGFAQRTPSNTKIDSRHEALLSECLSYFNQLNQYSI